MRKQLVVWGLALASLGLAGCCCCPQGGPRAPTDAACRKAGPCWPIERNQLRERETQLTPALNKAVGCPGFSDGYQYTQLPWRCDTRYGR